MDTPNTHICDILLSWLGTGTSKKMVGLNTYTWTFTATPNMTEEIYSNNIQM
jgi:hypothetical protein